MIEIERHSCEGRKPKINYRLGDRETHMKKNKSKIMMIFTIIIITLVLMGCVAHSKTGTNYLKEKKYDKAISEFELSIKKGENISDAYLGIALANYESENYEAALLAFDEAKANGLNETVDIAIYKANCHKLLGDETATEVEYEKALKMPEITEKDKKDILTYFIFKYESVNDLEKIKGYVKEYITAFPDDEAMQKEAKLLKVE
jgi:tetratricopeptide (TPR) repeat protein